LRIPLFIYGAASAAIGLVLLAPAHAYAASGTGEDTPLNLPADGGAKKITGASGSGSIVRTIVGLAIVLGVIYGLYWVLKQVKASGEEQVSGTGLEPLATLPLGANRSLQLVRAGQEVVLVGVAEQSVTLIRTYGENEARALGLLVDAPEVTSEPEPRRTRGFSLLLDQLRSRTVIR
jgi:flagellar protein FliO/FliZ